MSNNELTWEEVRKTLNITPEEEEELRLERELIETTIKARKESNMSQRELSQKSGIKQPTIARIERGKCSPTASTLIRLLVPMGYTLRIVPINKSNNKNV